MTELVYLVGLFGHPFALLGILLSIMSMSCGSPDWGLFVSIVVLVCSLLLLVVPFIYTITHK